MLVHSSSQLLHFSNCGLHYTVLLHRRSSSFNTPRENYNFSVSAGALGLQWRLAHSLRRAEGWIIEYSGLYSEARAVISSTIFCDCAKIFLRHRNISFDQLNTLNVPVGTFVDLIKFFQQSTGSPRKRQRANFTLTKKD